MENYIKKVFKDMPTPTMVLMANAPHFTITDVNDAYLALIGRSRESFLNKTFSDAFQNVPNSHTLVWTSLLEQTVATGMANKTPVSRLSVPIDDQNKEDKFFVVTNTPVLNEQSEVEFIVRQVTDVSDIVKSQKFGSMTANEKLLDETQRIARVGGWEADLINHVVVWSDMVKEIYEVESDYQPGTEFPEHFFKPGPERDKLISAFEEAIANGTLFDLEIPIITAKENDRWIRITGRAELIGGICTRLYGAVQDIHERRLIEDLENLEKIILDVNEEDESPIQKMLLKYLTGIEAIFPKMKCSVLGIVNGQLRNWSSPSLPSAYIQAVENLPIGENVGSCGTAAYLKQKVIVCNIETDPRWADYKDIALSHGLKACWSHPIMTSDDKVIATFAAYYEEVRFPNEDEVKVIDRAISIIKVILENRYIQKELLASESRLRGLVEAQTNYVIRTDLDGNYTYYNKKYEEDFGWFYENQDFLNVNCMSSVIPTYRQLVVDTVQSCLRHPGKICPVEVDQVGKDQAVRSVYWHFLALTDDSGRPVEVQCIGIDLSDRKQADNALKRSNERYELINKATNDATYDWDLLNDHIEWGEGFYRIFGFDREADRYSMDKWSQLVHPADKLAIEDGLEMVLADHKQSKWTAKYRFRKVDMSYAFVEETGYIRRNRIGKAIRMVGVIRDVTDRLRYISEIEERNEKLKEIAWLQSHVIRAPLARVMGLVDLIRNYENTEAENDEFLAHLITSANELDNIIREISSKAEQLG